MFETTKYENKVPEHLLNGLIMWGKKQCQCGGFLTAVLKNDLMEAIGRADEHSLAAIKYVAMFVYNELPRDCHGSQAKVDAWLKQIDLIEMADVTIPGDCLRDVDGR